uniref:G patch domain-containing protein 11 n=1 Tax=Phallusia mammillata TaxID=59560 RepID=A0A6F9DEI5_9ASCI|nr:G patch domain-containing protein 11-like [Phallusia mammillata]
MAEDEEDDYMSNIFVEEPNPHKSLLCKPQKVARKHELENKRKDLNAKSRVQPRHIVEQESRTKGLATAITEDNPGFKLLAKMGYKIGEGLGAKGEGRTEPVPVDVKSGRTGLGRDSAVKEAQARRQKMQVVVKEKRAKLEKIQHKQFRERMRDRFNYKQVEHDLYKSQKVCLHLDESSDIERPKCDFYWPSIVTEDEQNEDSEDDDDDEEISPDDKLILLTEYLRTEYFYCIWCGHRFSDKNELSQECPGNTAACHDDDC